jgi:integrase
LHVLWLKTSARVAIEITDELAEVIARINDHPKSATSARPDPGRERTTLDLQRIRSRFEKARTLAKMDFQFRDIRGKAATDTGNLAHSQKLLGHKNREMTEHYVKARMGERVKPLR